MRINLHPKRDLFTADIVLYCDDDDRVKRAQAITPIGEKAAFGALDTMPQNPTYDQAMRAYAEALPGVCIEWRLNEE